MDIIFETDNDHENIKQRERSHYSIIKEFIMDIKVLRFQLTIQCLFETIVLCNYAIHDVINESI